MKDIAAYVATSIELAQIKIFEQIKFIFKLGKSKKKYKFQPSPPELEFIQFVYQLSKEKKAVIDKIGVKSTIQSDMVNQMMGKIDDQVMKRPLNPFEEKFIDFIK